MANTARPILQFHDVMLDREKLEVRKSGALVSLEPKSLKVLEYLIENRSRVVTKEELIAQIWEGAFVTDNALTRAVAQLRKGLGDDARQARYIETVPTVGYRFIGRLVGADGEPEPKESANAPGVAPPGDVPGMPEPEHAAADPRRINWLVPVGAVTAIALTWVMPYFKKAPGGPDTAPRTTQFTTSPGLDLHPSFSPDGSAVVYASDRSGHFEIYVRPLGDGREVAVTADGKENGEPAWSPDGTQVAYTQYPSRGIAVVPALGGMSRKLSPFGSQPAWSPDGRRIAFRSEGITSLGLPETAPSGASTIWEVSAEGGAAQPLTRENQPAGRHSEPKFSRDGRYLAFLCFGHMRQSSLYEQELATGKLQAVTSGLPAVATYAYGGDGLTVYFVGVSEGDLTGLYRLDRDPRTRMPLGAAKLLTRIDFVQVRDLTISARGDRMAYTATRMFSNLWQVDASGRSTPLINESTFRVTQPAFSPDGARVAYLMRRQGSLGDIYVVDAQGGGAQQVTRDTAPDYMASWGPDSQTLFYLRHREGKLLLRRFSFADGSDRQEAEIGTWKAWARVSPDGKSVAGMTDNKVFVIDVAGGRQRELATGDVPVGYPVWSPDSRTLAVEMRKDGNTHVGLLAVDGGPLRQISDRPGHAWPHSWSADGKSLALAATWDGPWNLYTLPVAGGGARKVTANGLLRVFVRYPAWSPKGEAIVYEHNETRGNLYVADMAPPAAATPPGR